MKICDMCASRRDKPAYTTTCKKCVTEHCDHMRCGCGRPPVLLKTRKDAPRYPVVMRCACGRDLEAVMVSGEVSNRGTRRCACGVKIGFELELVSHVDRPLYRVASVELLLTP